MSEPLNLSDEDIVACLALLTRYQRAFMQRETDRKIIEEAQTRLAECDVTIAQLKSAFSVFGIDVSGTGFQDLQQVAGDAYWAALERAGWQRPPPLPPPPPPMLEDLTDDLPGDDVFDAEPLGTVSEPTASVRDLTLDYLKAAKDKGIKAAEARAHVEALRHTRLHEKTIGMTLYRLSQDGLARREGRTWFYVPPKAATKNPGGDAPGPNGVFD